MEGKRIEDLAIGDKAVYTLAYDSGYQVGTVEKVSNTQITVDGVRYLKNDGIKVGDGQRVHRQRLAKNSLHWHILMTVEEAKSANEQIKLEKQIDDLAYKISEVKRSHLKTLSVAVLQQIITLMQLKEAE